MAIAYIYIILKDCSNYIANELELPQSFAKCWYEFQ